MADVTLSWGASPSSSVTAYSVIFTVNGTAQAPLTVARTSANDTAGYTSDFDSAFPSVTLNPGDVIGASVIAVDAPDSLNSTPDVATAVTIPTTPVAPQPPVNATLTVN